jgi:hypothetical protein
VLTLAATRRRRAKERARFQADLNSNYTGTSMAVCFEVHAKFRACHRSPRPSILLLLKSVSTVVGSVRGASLFKHTHKDFYDPNTQKSLYGDQHQPILSRDLIVAACNQKNILEIYSANMASKKPVAKRTKLVFLVHVI